MRLKSFSVLAASLLLAACVPLDVTPIKLDIVHMKAYARPTNPKHPDYDLDLSKDLLRLHKMTCFSADDLAEIEQKLNACR